MNPPPLPPPAAAPTTVPPTSVGQAQALAVQQASAQPTQRQVAQAVPAIIQTAPAIGAATAHLPMAKAVPIHQSQGHAQVAAQSAHKAISARQSQGHVQLAQPLLQPIYPTQQQMIAVQAPTTNTAIDNATRSGHKSGAYSSCTYLTNGTATGIIASTTASSAATSTI